MAENDKVVYLFDDPNRLSMLDLLAYRADLRDYPQHHEQVRDRIAEVEHWIVELLEEMVNPTEPFATWEEFMFWLDTVPTGTVH